MLDGNSNAHTWHLNDSQAEFSRFISFRYYLGHPLHFQPLEERVDTRLPKASKRS